MKKTNGSGSNSSSGKEGDESKEWLGKHGYAEQNEGRKSEEDGRKCSLGFRGLLRIFIQVPRKKSPYIDAGNRMLHDDVLRNQSAHRGQVWSTFFCPSNC